MGRERQSEWEKRVAGWRESGLTVKAFAEEAGVNRNTLTHWAWQVRRKGGRSKISPEHLAEAKRRQRQPGETSSAGWCSIQK